MARKQVSLQQKVDQDYPEMAQLAQLLDSKWRVPGIGLRFGIDGVAGLVPVVGDAATGLVSAYLIYRAHRLGAPRELLTRMVVNVGVDVAVGSIPVVGTVFDFFFKANNINIRLLREHLAERGKNLPQPLPGQSPRTASGLPAFGTAKPSEAA